MHKGHWHKGYKGCRAALSRYGVNVKAVAGMTVGSSVLVRLIADDEGPARAALEAASIPFEQHEIVTVLLENRAGAMRFSRVSARTASSINRMMWLCFPTGKPERDSCRSTSLRARATSEGWGSAVGFSGTVSTTHTRSPGSMPNSPRVRAFNGSRCLPPPIGTRDREIDRARQHRSATDRLRPPCATYHRESSSPQRRRSPLL